MPEQALHRQHEKTRPAQISVGPVRPTERIEQIDILRGIALFGVLVINLLGEFRVSIFQQFASTPPVANPIDRWINTYIPLFIE